MIVRILGEGSFDVPEADMPAVEQLDAALVDTLERGDEAAFSGVLADLIGLVRHTGKQLPPDDVRTSELAVPHPGSTLAEVRELLAGGP
jgi:hypothetical protein